MTDNKFLLKSLLISQLDKIVAKKECINNNYL